MENAQVNSEKLKEALEIVSNSSLIDFLNNEENCEENIDEFKLFSEINRLASLNSSKYDINDDDRTIEEILREAETLINQPIGVDETFTYENPSSEVQHGNADQYDYSTVKTLSHPDVSFFY